MLFAELLRLASGVAHADTLPVAATDVAVHWDTLYIFLVALSAFFFVLVVGGMIYFSLKYRYDESRKSKYITDHHLLEAAWTIIPTILLLVIFGWGYAVYHEMREAPADAYEIHVIAKQWLWTFQYNDGRVSVADLYVPAFKPVKLIMTSEDVIHSFFVPNFRIKQDVVPGMYTSVWFQANLPGKNQIFCAEYCGTSHSGMLGQVIALTPDQWDAWTHGKKLGPIPRAGQQLTQADIDEANKEASLSTASLPEQGKALYQKKGCMACHSVDGSPKVGPTWKGLYGSKVALADGSSVTADDNYIRESIESPQAKIVKGFGPVMPTFKGLVNSQEINALIAYIKSLK